MLSDPQFWVAVAFIIFLLAIFNPVRKILGASLDAKIKDIINSIEEAENLKEETQVILSDIKKRQNEVKIEIESINKNAKERMLILEAQAEEKFKEQSNKRELLASAKIDQITRDTNTSVQQHITQTALEAAVNLLKKKLDQNEKQNLINQSIKDLGNIFKN